MERKERQERKPKIQVAGGRRKISENTKIENMTTEGNGENRMCISC